MYLDDRHLTAKHKNNAHLKKDPESITNINGIELLEALGAIPTLQEKSSAKRGLPQLLL